MKRDKATENAIYMESLAPIAEALGIKSHTTHRELVGTRELTSLILGTISQKVAYGKSLRKQVKQLQKDLDETRQLPIFPE